MSSQSNRKLFPAMIRPMTCFIVALNIALFAPSIRAQQPPPANHATTPPRAALTQLKLDAERALPSASAACLFHIGDSVVLLSGGNAWLVQADGDTKPVARGRDIRDCSIAAGAQSAYLLGGVVSNQPSASVWRVSLNGDALQWDLVAELPSPCAKPSSTSIGTDLYIGGQANGGTNFFLKFRPGTRQFEPVVPPPSLAVILSLGAQGDSLFLAGTDTAGTQQFWKRKDGRWSPASPPPEPLEALPPVAIGQSHLLYATASKTVPLLAFHTVTATWSPIPAQEGETVAMAGLKAGLLRAVKNGDASLTLRIESLTHPKKGLGLLDYVTLAGYFGLNLGIGFLCAKRKSTSDEFFRGGGRIQWWALGISYMATGVSSISFMAYPATGYASNWLLIGVPVFQSVAVVVTGFLFIGLLRRLNITTVFEYLELRFGRAIRLLGSALMILSQVGGRLSVVLLLPSMAFSAVTGLNVYVSVTLMGVVTMIYCLKGGMKAVVWTDVLQFGLMYGAIAVALTIITSNVPGGLGGLLSVASAEGKLKSFSFDWNLVQPTVWVFSCLAVTTVFLQLSDQSLMQRALSASDEKAARNSVIFGGLLTLPIGLALFFTGSALFVFYRHHPELLDPTLPNDSIFPFFIGNELPSGLAGLIIAGIFAAAMSTVSGTVNAIAAITVRDFLLPHRPASSEAEQMKLAKLTTVVTSGLATLIATIMAGMNIQSLWETFATLIALIGGGFPGIFALGLLTKRANAPGVAIGLIASIGITFAVKHYTTTNVFLYTSVAVGSCLAVGYIASLLFAPPANSLDGLTVHTLKRKA